MFPTLMGEQTFGRMAKAGPRRMRYGDASDPLNLFGGGSLTNPGASSAAPAASDGLPPDDAQSGTFTYSGGAFSNTSALGVSDPLAGTMFSNTSGSTGSASASASGVNGSTSNASANSSSWLSGLGSAVGSIFGSAAKAAAPGALPPAPAPGIFGSGGAGSIIIVAGIGLAAYLFYSEEKDKRYAREDTGPAMSGYRKRKRHHRRRR